MKRKLKAFVMMVFVSVIFLSSGCTTEHYTYVTPPPHRVVVIRHHPRIYKVRHHRVIYYFNYYPTGVYTPLR